MGIQAFHSQGLERAYSEMDDLILHHKYACEHHVTCALEVYLSRAASQLQPLIAEIVALKAATFGK